MPADRWSAARDADLPGVGPGRRVPPSSRSSSLILRTGLFRRSVYWIAMAIVFVFMIPVDGWLTKLSAPIVAYEPGDVSGWRPVWDILAEEFATPSPC